MIGVPIDMPESCSECFFRSKYEDISADVHEGTFKRIARCMIAPEEEEDEEKDVYRDLNWLMANRFPWCPLVPIPKGHGDLIDTNVDPRQYVEVWECNCSENGNQTVMAVDDLKYLPTIIEADK